ncbi:Com family DNA-binding transcriptional regulator [Desulfovibrio sp.]|uniref:Com family DNA-binding transcriptional regulator n=1 Tax=Desulfovibrio sp. TaxID=885 RepID=UPI003D0B671F
MQTDNRNEIRCQRCGRLLAKGQAKEMEFKCPRCGAYTIVRATRPSSEPPDGPRSLSHESI